MRNINNSPAERPHLLPTGWYLPGIVHPEDVPKPGPIEQAELDKLGGEEPIIPWESLKEGKAVRHKKDH